VKLIHLESVFDSFVALHLFEVSPPLMDLWKLGEFELNAEIWMTLVLEEDLGGKKVFAKKR